MSTTLSKLKLVSVQADLKNPTVLRRKRLTAHLCNQISYAKGAIAGEVFAEKRLKNVSDKETGERRHEQVSKRVKPWFFTTATGKINLMLRYGAKQIEIAKGKNAIECDGMAELVATLEVIKAAVIAGELDAQIELACGALRAGFVKKKKA